MSVHHCPGADDAPTLNSTQLSDAQPSWSPGSCVLPRLSPRGRYRTVPLTTVWICSLCAEMQKSTKRKPPGRAARHVDPELMRSKHQGEQWRKNICHIRRPHRGNSQLNATKSATGTNTCRRVCKLHNSGTGRWTNRHCTLYCMHDVFFIVRKAELDAAPCRPFSRTRRMIFIVTYLNTRLHA